MFNSIQLVFADMCGGPGGFTEFLFWKRNLSGKKSLGFGLTLKGNQDYKLESMLLADIADSFEPHYGADGSGNILKTRNIDAFVSHVLRKTESRGVDLVLADGAFSILGDEMNQEEHSIQIVLCQVLAMFQLLKARGSFLLKCFDLTSPVSVQILYLLYTHFERIAIVKPLTSRPANGERFILCENLRIPFPKPLIEHLRKVNDRMNDLKPPPATSDTAVVKSAHVAHQPGFMPREEKILLGLEEVTDIIDRDFVLSDKKFKSFLYGSNLRLAVKQRNALEEILKYASDGNKERFNQIEVRDRCLRHWNLPIANLN